MIALLLTLFALLLFHQLYWKRRNLPPGPLPLPFIGNMLTLMRHEPGYSAYEMWRKQYGPVYTIWMGTYPFVVVADYTTIKETFIKDGESYMNKFNFGETTKEYRGGEYGVVDTNGLVWKDHRRFAIHLLKDLGLGKNKMEQMVLLEVEALCSSLKSEAGNELSMQENIDVAVGSVINQLLFGYRFDEEHLSEFLELKTLISKQMREFAHPIALFIIMVPSLKYLPHFKQLWEKLLNYRDAFYTFFGDQIKNHEKEIDFDTDEVFDYVDAYLKEKRRREADGDEESFSTIQLKNMCLDLWFAGMETTSNTLSWAVVYILNKKEVQTKLHEELDRVISSDRLITMADRSQLPYTNAVINETQRLANLLPSNLPHCTTRPVVINGHPIPENTAIIAQISTVLYDEKTFPEPLNFDPKRFLDEEGKLKKVEELVPFSIGKRQCLGEGLARMELFLFIANIFNRFKLSNLDEDSPPSMKKTYGTTVQPTEYKCIVTSRY